MSKKKEARTEKGQPKCLCPYCEEEIPCSPLPICQPCGVTLRYCAKCQIAVEKEATVCPKCGGPIE